MPVVNDYRALLSDFYWTGSEETGQSAFVTYSFPTSAPAHLNDYYTPLQLNSWTGFDSSYQAFAEQAIAELEAVTGLRFLEVETGGDVTFQWFDFNNIPGSSSFAGYAFYPNLYARDGTTPDTVDPISGDIFLNSSSFIGGQGWLEVIIHELGHAVGLDHPFEGAYTLPANLDNVQQTVMSYTSVPGYFANKYGPIDVDALGAIYGSPANFAAHLSDWSWDAAANELSQTGTGGGDLIQGISTADYIQGMEGDDTMAGFAGDDFISAAAGADYASGGDGNDRLFMGAGTDTADGGFGNDEIGGGAGRDSLDGGAGQDTLYGGADEDLLYGGEDSDVVWAGTGDDQLIEFYADSANDTLGGGAGNDTVFAGGGNDVLYGGKGDAASNGDRLSGEAGDDTIFGGNGADWLWGDAGDDLLFGGTGNDSLMGLEGADTLWAGAGDDNIWGGDGADVFGFVDGSGDDTIQDFNPAEDRIDLTEYNISLNELLSNLNDFGNGVDLVLNGGDEITIFGVSPGDVSDFVLI